MLRHRGEMKVVPMERCHDGLGLLTARLVLGPGDSQVCIAFIHDDILEPGATIGEHRHEGNEDLCFVQPGLCPR